MRKLDTNKLKDLFSYHPNMSEARKKKHAANNEICCKFVEALAILVNDGNKELDEFTVICDFFIESLQALINDVSNKQLLESTIDGTLSDVLRQAYNLDFQNEAIFIDLAWEIQRIRMLINQLITHEHLNISHYDIFINEPEA